MSPAPAAPAPPEPSLLRGLLKAGFEELAPAGLPPTPDPPDFDQMRASARIVRESPPSTLARPAQVAGWLARSASKDVPPWLEQVFGAGWGQPWAWLGVLGGLALYAAGAALVAAILAG